MITRAIAACKTIRLKGFRLSPRNKRSPRIRLIIPNYHNTNTGAVWHLNSGFVGTNYTIYTFFLKLTGTNKYYRTLRSTTYSLQYHQA